MRSRPRAYRHLIEILVVDDGSTDGTWSYLSELEPTRSNIKIFQQPHTGGPSAGRNRALSEATGSYVFFHDADDYLGPDALRRLLVVAQQNDSDIVVASVSWIGSRTLRRVRGGRCLTLTFWMTASGTLTPPS